MIDWKRPPQLLQDTDGRPSWSYPWPDWFLGMVTVNHKTLGTIRSIYYGTLDDYADFVDQYGDDFGWSSADIEWIAEVNLPEGTKDE